MSFSSREFRQFAVRDQSEISRPVVWEINPLAVEIPTTQYNVESIREI